MVLTKTQVNSNRTWNPERPIRGSQAGFTLIEILIALAIFSIGMLGILSSVNSVMFHQANARDMSLATLYSTQKIEEIKQIATNEPAGGGFGFDYLLGTWPSASTMTSVDNWTYSDTDTPQTGFTRTWTLSAYPAGGSNPHLADAANRAQVNMVQVSVTTSWTDSRGNTHSVPISVLLHRRQFIQ